MKEMEMKVENYNIKYFDELDSTHKYIKENVKKLESKTIVVANIQNNGIGTHGRAWYTGNSKNIAMSLLYKPDATVEKLNTITTDIAKCIKNSIKELYNIELEIKMPNDLLLNSKKICGILTEINTISAKVNYIIISIGFNVNEDSFNEKIEKIATSLKKEYGREFNREKIFKKFVQELDKKIIKNLTSQTNEN